MTRILSKKKLILVTINPSKCQNVEQELLH